MSFFANDPSVVKTKTKVVMSKVLADKLVKRAASYERIALVLRDELTETNEMLEVALHQLAKANSAKDAQSFARRWRTEHRAILRHEDDQGVPIKRKR